MNILVLDGDGIGPEVMREAEKILTAIAPDIECEHGLVGGAAIAVSGHPLPPQTREKAARADAILFGAVGDARYDSLARDLRPEQAILTLRAELGLFANLRPVRMFAGLESASTLRFDVATGIDLLIVRELNGDVYFGEKAIRLTETGEREGYDIMSYSESEVRRIAHVAFRAAQKRQGRLCSVDKANVLETSQLWREVVCAVAWHYPDVALSHLYVDNAAMQLVRDPGQFDVIVSGNLFGDILSDQAAMCAGSIGLLASASLGGADIGGGVVVAGANDTEGADSGKSAMGLYEPIHGSAPDIAGQNIANPLAMILSLAMLLRYSGGDEVKATQIEQAVARALADGARTRDMGGEMTTSAMGDKVLSALAC